MVGGLQHQPSQVIRRHAPWVHAQQDAFTKWVNYRLERGGHPQIQSLTNGDLRSKALVNLLETVSGKKITETTYENPKNKYEEIANIGAALHFMKNEGIRMENIGAEDIWDGEERRHIILGLIWLIILHYQIKQFDESERAARDRLLEWVRKQCAPYGVPVNNFNNSFNDGKVLGALIASLSPELDFSKDIKDNNRVGNMEIALRIGEEDLQIPAILDPNDESIGTRDGEKQVMTYCALAMDKYGDGAPVKFRPADGKQCYAYGPGLEPGNHAEQRCRFTVQTVSKHGKNKTDGGDDVELRVTDENGNLVESSIVDNGNGTYSCTYSPMHKGLYTVDVKVNGDDIKNNPFKVDILRRWSPTVAGNSIAYGPNLLSGRAGEENVFYVEARDKDNERVSVGGDECTVTLVDGKGNQVPVIVTDNNDGIYTCKYSPSAPGVYKLTPQLNGDNVKDAPFETKIDPKVFKSNIRGLSRVGKPDAEHSLAYGPGIDGRTATRRAQPFTVELRDAFDNRILKGGDDVTVDITNPDGSKQSGMVEDHNNGLYTVTYSVPQIGDYTITPRVDGNEICTKVKTYYPLGNIAFVDAFGPGLSRGVVGQPAEFNIRCEDINGKDVFLDDDKRLVIIAKDETGSRCDTVLERNDKKILYDANYDPEVPGTHNIEIYLDEKLVAGPFVAEIGESVADKFNLQRGEEVKIDSPRIVVALGWRNKTKKVDMDLDASVVMLRHFRKFDHVYFNEPKSLDGAVVHSGDVRSGKKDGDLEEIHINLDHVTPKCNTMLIAVTVWNKERDLSMVQSAYVRLYDQSSLKELCRYTLHDIGAYSGLLMCKLYRSKPSEWKMVAIGKPGHGRVFDKLCVREMVTEHLVPQPPPLKVQVKVHSAKGLRAADPETNSSNPFAIIKLDMDRARTKVVEKSLDPEFSASFRLSGHSDVVEVMLWHSGPKIIPSNPPSPATAPPAAHSEHGLRARLHRAQERAGDLPELPVKVPEPVTGAVKGTKGFIKGLAGKGKEAATKVVDTGKSAAGKVVDTGKEVGGKMVDTSKEMGGKVATKAFDVGDNILEMGRDKLLGEHKEEKAEVPLSEIESGMRKENDVFLGVVNVKIEKDETGKYKSVGTRWYNLQSRGDPFDFPVAGKIKLTVNIVEEFRPSQTTGVGAAEGGDVPEGEQVEVPAPASST